MMNRRHFLTATAAVSVATLATQVFAAEPLVYSAGGGIAINGYDPVAYFTQSDAVVGSDAFTSDYNGAIFQFASAEHKAMFDAAPTAFAPQYGGYCAYAVSKGYTASTDPHAWTVYDGKLYLNYSKSVQALWTLRRAHHIASADENWPNVLG